MKTGIDFHINPSHVLLFLIENKQNFVTDMHFWDFFTVAVILKD